MTDVLPSIISDPELTVESDEDLLAPDENVQVEIKENVDTDDVFDRPKKPKKEQTDTTIKPIKSGKQRKPMSEEHKAKLALAREKAVQARRIKAEEKKKIKELENQVKAKQKVQKIKEMENIVNDVVELKPEPKPVKAEIDETVIQKAIEEALTKNEMMRQKRKQEKRQKEDEAIRVAKAQEEIRKAVYPAKLYAGDQGFASKYIYNFQ